MESTQVKKDSIPMAKLPEHQVETLSFDDVQNGIPTGIWITGAPLLWKQKIEGEGVVVGVIDTGIDDTHPDLRGRVTHRDFVNDNVPMSQWNLHGTHVAGTIAANGTIKGMAPKARLIDYRVLDVDGSGSFEAITKAIKRSIEDKCDIINLSLGGPSDYAPMHAIIKTAVDRGILVVVAAGNDGLKRPKPQISYPANYSEVVAVGAVEFNARTGTIDSVAFSSETPQVDIAADGFKVLSTVPNGGYAELSGTSMATPHIAGFAALILQKLRKLSLIGPEVGSLWGMMKDNTIDVFQTGIDWKTGCGFATVYPALPQKQGAKWVIPGMETGQPL